MSATQVFYSPGDHNIIDIATPDGKTQCLRESLEQVRKRYPRAILTDFDAAVSECEKAKTARYNVGVAQKTDKEGFMSALECLPPRFWKSDDNSESFQMSEMLCGSITTAYCRIGKQYFYVNVHIGTPHAEIKAMCQQCN